MCFDIINLSSFCTFFAGLWIKVLFDINKTKVVWKEQKYFKRNFYFNLLLHFSQICSLKKKKKKEF